MCSLLQSPHLLPLNVKIVFRGWKHFEIVNCKFHEGLKEGELIVTVYTVILINVYETNQDLDMKKGF